MSAHTCHAVNCGTPVPPRMHMCKKHWAMVPKAFQRALWASYRRGQESDKRPSAKYLRAAADCVRAVDEAEGQPAADIDAEVRSYVRAADFLEGARS